jgi:predicted phage-related endonuclease
VESCDSADRSCKLDPLQCGQSITDETQEVVPFQSKAMAIMQKIVDLNLQKKQLEAQDKDVRQQLEKVMGEYGIKQFENDLLKVTYVEPTTRATIDAKKLKEDLPAVAEKYTKRTTVKGSVRIEVK